MGEILGFNPPMNFLFFISSVHACVGSTFCRRRVNSSVYSSMVLRPCLSCSKSLTQFVFFRSETNLATNSYVKVVATGPCSPVHATILFFSTSYHLFALPYRYTGTTLSFF